MCRPVSGASYASLRTTVFPWMSAGAIFHTGIAIGKFHGVISATTPSGRRRVEMSEPVAACSKRSPTG